MNNGGGFFIPTTETEIEFMNKNDKKLKSFIEITRASRIYNKRFTHKNMNSNFTSNNNIKYSKNNNKHLKRFKLLLLKLIRIQMKMIYNNKN